MRHEGFSSHDGDGDLDDDGHADAGCAAEGIGPRGKIRIIIPRGPDINHIVLFILERAFAVAE